MERISELVDFATTAFKLNRQQAKYLCEFIHSPSSLWVLIGAGGSGKNFVGAVLAVICAINDRAVLLVAPTNMTNDVMYERVKFAWNVFEAQSEYGSQMSGSPLRLHTRSAELSAIHATNPASQAEHSRSTA